MSLLRYVVCMSAALAFYCWKSPSHTARDWRPTGVWAVCVCHWVLPGHRDRRRSEEGKSGLGKRLGATWSARFFPMFPSLYSIMNGFLLVCGRGLILNSILTKSQNTHSSQSVSQSVSLPACLPANQPASWPLSVQDHLSTCYKHTQLHIGCNDRNGFGGTYFGEFHVTWHYCRCLRLG